MNSKLNEIKMVICDQIYKREEQRLQNVPKKKFERKRKSIKQESAESTTKSIIDDIEDELKRASNIYSPVFSNYYEAIGVLSEEGFELFQELTKKEKDQDHNRIYEEAIQVAAMAIKTAMLARFFRNKKKQAMYNG